MLVLLSYKLILSTVYTSLQTPVKLRRSQSLEYSFTSPDSSLTGLSLTVCLKSLVNCSTDLRPTFPDPKHK